MDGKTLARIGAIGLVAVAILTTAIELNRKHVSSGASATDRGLVMLPDQLDDELLRCSMIGEAGTRDTGCLKAWAENRRRFLGQRSPPSSASVPTTLFPAETTPANKASPIEPARPEPR